MKSDLEIAQSAKKESIFEIAKKAGIGEEYLECYGKYKAKLNQDLEDSLKDKQDGTLILVTAINPTPAGEGKTTVTIGLTQALQKLNQDAIACLREPSLGPCMGMKGGATGGGYAQVVPMEDINLHFTGDIHAITSANNLLVSLIDNHIQQGNEKQIDPRKIVFQRVLDLNDRQLRHIVSGMGGVAHGGVREEGFQITVASEVMAIFCLATSLQDLKRMLGDMIVAYTYENEVVTARDINGHGAMTALLRDAFQPNMVQTLEQTPALIHGGPFANIAHGCNSLKATKLGLKLADYVITEAGFGADLGAEKFLDIKCRKGDLKPKVVVLVATIRALKYNGGVLKEDLGAENIEALQKGIVNLQKHIENMKLYQLPIVVTLNQFASDTEKEIAFVSGFCEKEGVSFALSEVFAKGGEGGIALAEMVLKTIAENPQDTFQYLYEDIQTIQEKIETVCKKIYGASDINFLQNAKKQLQDIERMGYGHFPICIAKTQFSLSDDASKLGRPEGFTVTVKELKISAGAGFVVVFLGDVLTMPGLSKYPTALEIDVDEEGNIVGLF